MHDDIVGRTMLPASFCLAAAVVFAAVGDEHCKSRCDTLEAVAEFLQPDCLQGRYKSVPHQYNETYFSALGADPKQYLMAR